MTAVTVSREPITATLISPFDVFAGHVFGTARYYRELQGNGCELRFQQVVQKGSRLGSAITCGRGLGRSILRKMSTLTPGIVFGRPQPQVIATQELLASLTSHELRASLVVVLDLIEIDYPDRVKNALRLAAARCRYSPIRYANRVVTISQYSKRQLVAQHGLDPAIVTVAPCGVDHILRDADPSLTKVEARARLGLDRLEVIVLYVGSEQRRKNLITLVKSLRLLALRKPSVRFVKIGGSQSTLGGGRFREAIRDSCFARAPIVIEQASEPELRLWYQAADVFAFPSVCEGFGLPLVEAMAFGIPVVCTNGGAIPETVGDAALSVTDAYDADEWAEALCDVIENEDRRLELAARGRNRAAQFRWSDSRKLFLSALRDTLSPGRTFESQIVR